MAIPGHKLDRDIYVNEEGALPLFRNIIEECDSESRLGDWDTSAPEESYIGQAPDWHRKKYGQFFTPGPIAEFMCRWVLEKNPRTVLDPGCGTGVFIREILRRAPGCNITGVDADPFILSAARNSIEEADGVNFIKGDFLTWEARHTFDAIVANPPYLKHHNFHYGCDIFKDIGAKNGVKVSRLANIYVLFILEISRRLADDGRAAIIVPGEWVNANFGKVIKEFLLDRGLLRALVYFSYSGCLFADALTTASIMLIEKGRHGRAVESVLTAYVEHDVEVEELYPILRMEDVHCPKIVCQRFALEELRDEKKWDSLLKARHGGVPKGYVRLSELADTRRGIATGANSFFHISEERVRALGIGARSVVACVGKARDVGSVIFRKRDYDLLREKQRRAWLLDFKEPLTEEEAEYLREGEKAGLPRRYLLSKRTPWYSMEKRDPAPIWAGVFVRRGLRFIFNEAGVRSLTAFHCIYPKDERRSFCKALTAVLNSRKVREYAARERRVYGGGLAKFEPADLLDICVPDIRSAKEATLCELGDTLDMLDAEIRNSDNGSEDILARLAAIVDKAQQEAAESGNND